MRILLKAVLIIPLLACTLLAEDINDYVTAEFSVNRDEVFVGETFEIFLTIRSHTVTLGQDFGLDNLAQNTITRLSENFSHYPVEKQVRNNRIEETRRFSWRAVGTAPGNVELTSMVDLAVLSRSTQLFFSRPKKTYFKVPAKKADITIRPLPAAGKPGNFSGAVGSFSLNVAISPREAAPGDVITLRTEVRGTGLLENVSAPLLTETADLKLYSPKLIASSPTLIYEQQIIPLTEKGLDLPTISFSFFDPNTKLYRTLKDGPFKITPRTKSAAATEAFRPEDSISEEVRTVLPGTPVSFRNASIGLAVVALLLVAAVLRRAQLSKHNRIIILTILSASLLSGIAYLIVLRSGYFQRNVYMVETQQKGMSAPASSALQILIIPSGTHVEQLACEAGWVLISHSGRQAWIPENALGSR